MCKKQRITHISPLIQVCNFFATTPTTAKQDSDEFILAPQSMRSTVHNNQNIVIQPDEFKLYGKLLVCKGVTISLR
jgi:hypothetical protein